ncbi:MAG TPA: phosphoribosylformimino-5-aminoimidazole carboxamide ribotide isomerase [Verrucomicrobiales bacterium]|nr:phosphoribosylformimino-5-aminoimidazole carboxamide ribotide isomerase [Verrucomicrobiales bacterium]
MSRFRPCIDLHEGRVKQIVGGTLTDDAAALRTNFVSAQPPEYFATLYRRDALTGGHVIMLGPGNTEAARSALAAWPGGMQIGGGITAHNATEWLDAGASHVIVTSWLFDAQGTFLPDRLTAMEDAAGRDRLVIDLSCRRDAGGGWTVCMNRWQTRTSLKVTPQTLDSLAGHCAEFLIHAADVEGRCEGMDEELLGLLGKWRGLPVTYAGGARSLADLQLAGDVTGGAVDVTIGSALDIFGGTGVRYSECVAWNRTH